MSFVGRIRFRGVVVALYLWGVGFYMVGFEGAWRSGVLHVVKKLVVVRDARLSVVRKVEARKDAKRCKGNATRSSHFTIRR